MVEEKDFYRKALDWFGENIGKWEDIRGETHFLIPESEVPEYVFQYIEACKIKRENNRKFCQMRKALGLNDWEKEPKGPRPIENEGFDYFED